MHRHVSACVYAVTLIAFFAIPFSKTTERSPTQRYDPWMHISAVFIKRPIATSLLMLGIALFGVIAYRALTGHPAFEGEKTAEILYKVVHAMPLRPSVAAPVNPDVDLALSIAIAKGPEDRFASAGELAAALEAASTGSLHPTLRARAERLLAALPWAGAPE